MAEAAIGGCAQQLSPPATSGEWDDNNIEHNENNHQHSTESGSRENISNECRNITSNYEPNNVNNLKKIQSTLTAITTSNDGVLSVPHPLAKNNNSDSKCKDTDRDNTNAPNSSKDNKSNISSDNIDKHFSDNLQYYLDNEVENVNNDGDDVDNVDDEDEDESNQTYYEAAGEPELVLAFENTMKITNDVTSNTMVKCAPLSDQQQMLANHKASSLLVSAEMDKPDDSLVSSSSRCHGIDGILDDEECEGAVGLVSSIADALKDGDGDLLKDVNVYPPMVNDFIRTDDVVEPVVVLRRKRGKSK